MKMFNHVMNMEIQIAKRVCL